MSNMDTTQRTQLERTDLLAGGEGIRHNSEKGVAIYNAIAFVIAGVLSLTAIAEITSWAQWVVLGGIIFTLVGFMIAISPNRRGI